MATAPPPPPPPPPPPQLCRNQPRSISPPPCPGYAAIPFVSVDTPPVPETNPPPEAIHDAGGTPAPPLLPVQNGCPSPPLEGQADNLSDSEEKWNPVQETSPAPQMTMQQDEAGIQMDQAAEDQLI